MKFLKKQGVAWVITVLMILIAIGIATPDTATPQPEVQPPAGDDYLCVCDDAGVLTADEERKLSDINRRLYNDMDVVIACVTTNYGKSDLYDFALDYADRLGLEEYDFIVVLDISGDNYWLVQGAGLVNQFTDADCSDYAWDYMEKDFARGDYGEALLSLADALSDWYYAQ